MYKASRWWASVKAGQFVSVALIQFDLAGHSAWSSAQEETGSRFQTFNVRKQLALSLRQAVQGYNADLHHWAGDGGLFALRCDSTDDADHAYEAMAQMYAAFDRWRNENDTTTSFSCRITASYIPDVCVDPDAGHWYSSELNSFLKYERQIGFPDRRGPPCVGKEM